MPDGWIKLHRKILENDMYRKRPFDEAHAWIDLLLLASYGESTIRKGEHDVTVKPGQICRSELYLAERWGWSRKKVRNFLRILREKGMGTTKGTAWGTTISLVNWDFFQNQGTTKGTTKGTHNKNTSKRSIKGASFGSQPPNTDKENFTSDEEDLSEYDIF